MHSPTPPIEPYAELCSHARETAMLYSIAGLLGWDQRTYMPAAANTYRADQIAFLSGEIHKRQTNPRLGELLSQLADNPDARDPHNTTGTVVRQLRRSYEKKTRLPQTLVEELSRTAILGEQAWVEARKADDFKAFLPLLERTLELKRQEAAALGFTTTPYDPLLDDYEQGATAAEVGPILAGLRDALTPLVEQIAGARRRIDDAIIRRQFPLAAQETFGKQVAAAIGFDFDSGRLDVTAHPFCGGGGPRDVRITTRYNEHDFADAFFSILHETGHGLYEQGLPADQFGLPTGETTSLAIHESQSRTWENQVGRSRGFWRHFLPLAKAAFPTPLADVELDAFYAAVNVVRPSLIRVDADEVTYNLHVLIRFELERAMVEGDLSAADLPGAWREKYQNYLGVTPPSDADGCLQDVHWSAGLFGYFPTYSLGNLYAGQFFAAAQAELGDLSAAFARGEFAGLLGWLRTNIHQHGQRYSARELAVRITGTPLSHDAWIGQMRTKYGELYGL